MLTDLKAFVEKENNQRAKMVFNALVEDLDIDDKTKREFIFENTKEKNTDTV